MRRKTRPKVVWLPNTNANSIGADTHSTAQAMVVAPSGVLGDFAVGEIPIVIDNIDSPLAAGNVSLADIFDSGYRLRRLVGKVWISCQQLAAATPATVLVTAGFIIRRSNPDTGISLALTAADANQLSPGDIDGSSDPWIWRRSWIVHNILSTAAVTGEFVGAPTNNFSPGCGSAVDGPHVDVKTGRIVTQDERLFLDVSALILRNPGDGQTAVNIDVIADIRALASMRTSVGNRKNASR